LKTALFVAAAVALAVLLVVGGLAAGFLIAGTRVWEPREGWFGRGMMGGWGRMAQPCSASSGCASGAFGAYGRPAGSAADLSLDDAHEAIEEYLRARQYDGLEIKELMEFERNFYAIVREADTGIGAMELLVNRSTGAVSPEPGPNMMWNAAYGMHGRGMMGASNGQNTISADEAVGIAQTWLDANQPGASAEHHADPFYGYYTIHTLRDGEIDGMLSVHGTTGQVWYHTWHGPFVQMLELEGEEHS
jgi:hypothetical protein